MKPAVNTEYPVLLPWTIPQLPSISKTTTSFQIEQWTIDKPIPTNAVSTIFAPTVSLICDFRENPFQFFFLPLFTSSSLCTLTPHKKNIRHRWVTMSLSFWIQSELLNSKSRFFQTIFQTISAYFENDSIEHELEEEEVNRIFPLSLRSLAITFGGLRFPFLPVLLHHLSPGGFKTFEVYSEYGAVEWGTSFGSSALDIWSFNFGGTNAIQTGTQYHKTQKKSVSHTFKYS